MFIAHAPAGYLVSWLASRRSDNARSLIATGVLFSLLPDTDLLWFYLIDNRQTPHHEYLFHLPLFWLTLAVIAGILAILTKRRDFLTHIYVALVCLMVHMLLDSFAAEIYWLRPFSDTHLNAVNVPAQFNWWVWNFVLHWTFIVEVMICVAALVVFLRSRKTS